VSDATPCFHGVPHRYIHADMYIMKWLTRESSRTNDPRPMSAMSKGHSRQRMGGRGRGHAGVVRHVPATRGRHGYRPIHPVREDNGPQRDVARSKRHQPRNRTDNSCSEQHWPSPDLQQGNHAPQSDGIRIATPIRQYVMTTASSRPTRTAHCSFHDTAE
jgi:hypothetical protein